MDNSPKINYQNICLKTIEELGESKPKLLLHGCCGPCSCFPILFLTPHFDVTIYYSNSNIYPEAEFDKRLSELKRLLENFEKDYGYHVNLVVVPYNHKEFIEDLLPYKDEPEGGKRCMVCYKKRLKDTFIYAKENNFDFVTTVMTISRQKNSMALNKIGEELQNEFAPVKYLFSDFKKKDGYLKGRVLRDKYNLYQQLCCGCEFSQNTCFGKQSENTKN